MIARRVTRAPGRRGGVLIAAMAALVLLAMVFGTLLTIARAERRRVQMQERRLQAEWLAESGLERAAARLAAAADYAGETWELAPADLGGREAGRVAIRVAVLPGRPDRRRVTAEAEFPRGSAGRVRRTKTTTLAIRPGPTGPKEDR